MDQRKIKFFHIVCFSLMQAVLYSLPCHSTDDLGLSETDPKGIPILKKETRIPVGSIGGIIHSIHFPSGTPLSEIPKKVSQKREKIGLLPDISHSERNQFFQNLHWQTSKTESVTMPMPGQLIAIFVNKGDLVKKGDKLCTVETMKMQNIMRAERDSVVGEIHYEVMDMVAYGTTLASLLPRDEDWETIAQGNILKNAGFLATLFPWHNDTLPNPPSTPSFPPSEETNRMERSNPAQNEPAEEVSHDAFQSTSLAAGSSSLSKLILSPSMDLVLETQSSSSLPPSFAPWMAGFSFGAPTNPPSSLKIPGHSAPRNDLLTHLCEALNEPKQSRYKATSPSTVVLNEAEVESINEHGFFKGMAGLMILLAFKIIYLARDYRLKRLQHRELHRQSFFLPTVQHLYGRDFNKHQYMTHQMAYNMNIQSVSMKAAA